VSAFAALSNLFVLKETLPHIVEARKAKQGSPAQEGDATVPLLGDAAGSEDAQTPDVEGAVKAASL
jgi:hypothetical protein